MADKAISELLAANQVTPTDLFVLEQSGVAKKLTGQTLENWLLSFADGHGGIQSIVKHSTSGLKDTYRITFADTTTFDFVVTNGRSVNSVTKTGTSGLVDTYAIEYNDGTSDEFTVTNGAKGDKGDNTYTHIKFASQEPTESSHSFGDVPDKWIGFYWGSSAAAPTDWTQYKWYQFKGDKGDTGSPATLTSAVVEYQMGNSGTIIPSEAWTASVPAVAQGKYLWTRTTQNFNTGSPVVSYSVSRMGLDGAGSVVSVNNVSPNADGNVVLTAEDVSARPNTWLPSIADIGAAPAGYADNGHDTVIAQGTSGDWNYRKWASGIAECWMSGCDFAKLGVSAGGYNRTSLAFPFTFADTNLMQNIAIQASEYAQNLTAIFVGKFPHYCEIVVHNQGSTDVSSVALDLSFTGRWK